MFLGEQTSFVESKRVRAVDMAVYIPLNRDAVNLNALYKMKF